MSQTLKPLSVSYKERNRVFNFVDGKYIAKPSTARLGYKPFLFPDKFYQHLETEKRYSLWIGGNGSAKSTTKARYFIKKCLEQQHFRLLFIRHHHSDVRNSIYLMFKGIITKENLDSRFNCLDSTMSILCYETGNMMVSAGLDSTGKLSGIDDFTDIWFEEPITRSNGKIEMITHEQFEDLDSRLRMPNAKLTMHLTLNPISKQFFIYKDLLNPELTAEKRKYNLDNWDICNSTYKDNPFLPQSAIDVIEGFTGTRAEYGKKGEWTNEKTGVEWLPNFLRSTHVANVPYINDLPVSMSFDFNLLPYQTCICVQVYRKKNDTLQIRVFKEYTLKPPLNTPENACKFFIQDFIEAYGFNNVSLYGDASGRFGYDNYHNLFTILGSYTHNDSDQVFTRNPPIRMARDLINEILNGEHSLELVIDESCVNLIDDLDSMQTAPDGFNNEKDRNGVEQKGHCYSALVYVVCKMFEYLMKHKQRNYSS